ncbi:hypothetical protein [Celeribacter baekdonensis]|uniref:Lipoprotein n=1 Tax=Celeribacter baekdonensis TaxID=875171 RepID=A0A2R4M3J6_9RHOB|nr:hypothetical protein [Celeribacter baekdonensis]AVW91726.1 hypothetical protein DA792_12105 [Celeribacter baekdonensis]
MRAALWIALAIFALSACQAEAPETGGGYGLAGYDPGGRAQKTACETRGGAFKPGGASGALACFVTPKDAGKSCSKSTECSTGNCLARSQTCSPIEPLFGCNELLDTEGRRVTLCVD